MSTRPTPFDWIPPLKPPPCRCTLGLVESARTTRSPNLFFVEDRTRYTTKRPCPNCAYGAYKPGASDYNVPSGHATESLYAIHRTLQKELATTHCGRVHRFRTESPDKGLNLSCEKSPATGYKRRPFEKTPFLKGPCISSNLRMVPSTLWSNTLWG